MKTHRSRKLAWLALPLIPVLLMLAVIWLADMDATASRGRLGATPPESRNFSVTSPATWPVTARRSRALLDDGEDFLMTWEHNPWRKERPFGQETMSLRYSDSPEEQARFAELRKAAIAWYEKVLARYPELAPKYKEVPDGRNGLLAWVNLMKRLSALSPDGGAVLKVPPSFFASLRESVEWDGPTARTWMNENRALMDEIRQIGLMPDRSAKGIPWEELFPMGAQEGTFERGMTALIMEARLAAEDGDAAGALEAARAAKGLANHLNQSELTGLTAGFRGAGINRYIIEEIMPSLPPGSLDIGAWETLVNPVDIDPEVATGLTRTSWRWTMIEDLLPSLLNPDEAKPPSDPEALVEVYTRQTLLRMENAASVAAGSALPPPPSTAGLSNRSAVILKDQLPGGYYGHSVTTINRRQEMYRAAFAVMKGAPVPTPVNGKAYQWDEANRRLSMAAGKGVSVYNTVVVPDLNR